MHSRLTYTKCQVKILKYRILVLFQAIYKLKETKTQILFIWKLLSFSKCLTSRFPSFHINCKDYTCMYVWFIPVDRSNRPLCFVHYVLLYNQFFQIYSIISLKRPI